MDDDDFGDLYADVEVQATTAINGLPSLCQLYQEHDVTCPKESDLATEKGDSAGEEEVKRTLNAVPDSEKEVIADNGSDSEDDLNILLNDDDDGLAVPNIRGGFNDGEVEESGDFGAVVEGNGSEKNRRWVDQALEQSSNGVGGSEKGVGAKGSYHAQYSQFKYIRPFTSAVPSTSKANGSVAVAGFSSTFLPFDSEDNGSNQQMLSNPALAQSGYNFSLPRNKTILDVSIDVFERKPWRYPGADMTAFFNFDFDEESWKHYCNCLEQCRQQAFLPITRTPVSDPLKSIEPKGRSIQVEDSTIDRKPSFDTSRRLGRDSDVIQIPLQDPAEDSPGLGKENVGHLDTVCQSTEIGQPGMTDIHCFQGVSKDEFPKLSLEGNVESLDSPVPERCSHQTTPSNAVSMHSNYDGSGHVCDAHKLQLQTVGNPEENADTMETSNIERVEGNTCNTTPSNAEMESSHGEQSQYNLSFSCSGTHSEPCIDGAHIDPEKVCNPKRRLPSISPSELQESITSDYHHAKEANRHDAKRMCNGYKYYSRNRSPIPENPKRYDRRVNSATGLKRRYKDEYGPSFRDSEESYDMDNLRFKRNRQKERLQHSNSHDGEHLSSLRESELSFDYFGDRFYCNQVQTAYSKNIFRKGRRSYDVELDRSLARKRDEENFFLGQRKPKVNGEVVYGDWYNQRRRLNVSERDPLSKENRRLISKDFFHLEEETCYRPRDREDTRHFRKRTKDGDFLVKHNYADDFIEEENGRFFPHDNVEMDYHDYRYDMNLTCTRREFENSYRSDRICNSPSIDLETFWPRSDEDDYQRLTRFRHVSSSYYKDLPDVNGRRWRDTPPPREDVYHLRELKSNGRQSTQIQSHRCHSSDWPGSYSDSYDMDERISYPDHQGHIEQTRHHQHSEVLHWTESGYISRHWDDRHHDREMSFTNSSRTSRHKQIDTKHNANVSQEGWHKYKQTREGNSNICTKRSSNATPRYNHEQTLTRCRNSVDFNLVVRERKSPGRRSENGGLLCNGGTESTEWNINKTGLVSNEPFSEKGGHADDQEVEIKQKNNGKWHDKFPGLDIEEGQIITEELNGNLTDKKECASEYVAKISDAKERITRDENVVDDGEKVTGECKQQRIIDMLAKMEKRRERFKEPVTQKKELDKIPEPEAAEEEVETTDTKSKSQRPARKRRWGGS